ncbi:transposase [Kitasatospora sp. NPDC004723]|uniref:transposase n=1 Tax=Kitasatospora sp. NPDC004723 TaxID=3154288 RepID=UPI0033ACD420
MKASPNAPADSQGYDGGKRVKGCKRHIATDTLGLLLVLIVTAAGVQNSRSRGPDGQRDRPGHVLSCWRGVRSSCRASR